MIHANPVSVASDLSRGNLKIKSYVYSLSKSLFDFFLQLHLFELNQVTVFHSWHIRIISNNMSEMFSMIADKVMLHFLSP